MILKHHHLLHNFMSRMSRSHNIEQAHLQKFIISSLHQPRIKKLYLNSPIPKLSSQEVASLVTEARTVHNKERTGGSKDDSKKWNYPIPKLSSKNVASLVRAQRDLSRLSRRSGGTEKGSGGTKETTGGTEARTGGIKKTADGNKERIGGTNDNNKQWNSTIPKLSSKKVASLVRARRDLSRLSRRSGGTEEGSGGTEERTGGTEERTGGTGERTGGTEDSYKQWRKMG